MMRRNPLCLVALLGAFVGLASPARADGLRIGVGLGAYNYKSGNESVGVYVTNLSARVSRGRAALTFGAPLMGISGTGTVVSNGEQIAVDPNGGGGSQGTRFGPGDMSMALDYNIIQNREKMWVVAVSGYTRFGTSPVMQKTSNGEFSGGLGLSSYYGLTRQLFLFADTRLTYRAIFTPASMTMGLAELGAVYWLTEGLGLTASLSYANFGSDEKGNARVPSSLEFNVGLMLEALPGTMVNLGGVGGLMGSAPQAGGAIGLGFEI